MKNIYTLLICFFGSLRFVNAQTPVLNSNPNSTYVIMLDFDGYADNSGWWTNWGTAGPIVTASSGYSTAQVTEVFNRVSEDYRPFDINITTSEAVFTATDVAKRQRVVLTPTDGFYNVNGNNAGGVAYIGVFGSGDIPCWVFTNKMGGSAANAAEAASHEAGHTLGLNHHARYNADCSYNTGYHSGQGSGQTSWAPIMGVGYGRNIVQWYNGATTASTCSTGYQDDLKVITTTNGFGYRTDDVADVPASATSLPLAGGSANATGLISTNTDVDVYKLSITSSGAYTISVAPYAHDAAGFSGANLDVKWTLKNSAGTVIGVSDPVATLNAVSTFSLNAGDYYLTIDGTGVSNYIATGGLGPNDYGSIGQYSLSATQLSCGAALLSSTNGERCGTGTVNLSATAAQGSTISWYSASSGGNPLATGSAYTTASISTSTTYYVEVNNGTCTSTRTPVTAIVASAPVLSPLTGSTTVQTGNTIQLSTTSTGGTWSSTNTNFATVSQTGLVTGIAAGNVSISYTVPAGICPASGVNLAITVTTTTPCPGTPTVTDVDGNVYNTILIGSQCWTKENLKTTKFADNTAISGVTIDASWSALTSGAWCNYSNNSQYNGIYGKLYNWYSAVDTKGLCPTGWHVPDQNEYSTAMSYLGGASVAGGKLKAVSGLWSQPNVSATDFSGFSGLPGGKRAATGTYSGLGTLGDFWTVSTSGSGANSYYLVNDTPNLASDVESKNTGQSVRCVKNPEGTSQPTIQQSYGNSRCDSGSVYLYAFPSAGTVYWYADAQGGSVLATGNSFATPSITSTTTYYAQAVLGNLVSSPRTAVVATINSPFTPGSLINSDATICNTGDPVNILFATQPTGATTYTYQWYYQDGLVVCPSGVSTIGWTLIVDATGNSYDPPAGLTGNRTYAVFVSPVTGGIGGGSEGGQCGSAGWAAGCRKIAVLPAFTPGTIASGDQTFCSSGDPVAMTLSVNPTGSGSYSWRWYFRETTNGNCPTGSTVPSGWATNSTSANITGTTATGAGITFDPISAGTLNNGRTFAVLITPGANGAIPACGTPQWASSCCKTFVISCNFVPGTLVSGNQTLCNPGDPAAIDFSASPSGGTGYAPQWYYKDGIATAPTGSSVSGWTAISGATQFSYNPPAGLAGSRTFACFVTPTGATGKWATGARQITILSTINYGTLASGNQTLTNPGDPANIVFSTAASGGSGVFLYQWYYQDGLIAAPTGTATTGWIAISAATVSNYDAPGGLTTSRSYACFVTPGGNLVCGPGTWANGVRQITVPIPNFDPGTLASGNQTICNGGDPGVISFSSSPSGGSGYSPQWYYQDGIISAPTGNSPLGWTIIQGANQFSYDPPAGLLTSRTYACLMGASGSNGLWVNGVRQITVLPAFNPGTITPGDQSFCNSGDPANILLSVNPTGSGAYTWKWYYRESATGECVTGNTVPLGWATNSTSPNITGTTTTGAGISFDPQSAGTVNKGRTFAVYITPKANGNIPACGTAQWANSCRRSVVNACIPSGSDIGEFSGTPFLFSVFPNPVSDQFTILADAFNDEDNLDVQIYDITGKSVYHQGFDGRTMEMKLSAADWSKGIYQVVVRSSEQVWTGRIMK